MTTAMATEDRYPRRMVRAALLSLSLLLLSAAPAFAQASDQGEGTYGPADDKVVTDVGFMLIAGFPVLIMLLSLLQQAHTPRRQVERPIAIVRYQGQEAEAAGETRASSKPGAPSAEPAVEASRLRLKGYPKEFLIEISPNWRSLGLALHRARQQGP